ncbi:hypothetical protein LY90DRAFT_513145 [Neocallimastix californiae]|uniref:Uncharacterized protein n=1 Tax=Neocallimastix californiae TaxID=1754190 RepID=A0A1Y2B0H3_9FUNG|nr:hypothetical protein LY90DRAFT_513145 [Neocallimastix californiae]|eukprot:ORY28348.1 hypothetical protein LY90DRAFT_513145 [Neocallimastix californiae]
MSDSATPTGGPPTAPEGFIIPSGCPQYYPVYINMELIAKADCGFEPNMVVENTLMIFMIIAYVPPLILYIINKDNVLIKYRQPRSVFIAGILSGINSIFVPVS